MDELPPDLPPDFPTEAPPAVPAPALALLPFDDARLPWFSAFFETIGLLVRRPREAFERVGLTLELLRPIVFAIVVGWIGIVASSAWQLSLRDTMRHWIPPNASYGAYDMSRGQWIWVAGMGPILIVCVLLFSACVTHLSLMLMGGAKRGFQMTLRVLCYTQVASLVLIFPICGSIVSGFWSLTLAIIGLSAAHGTTLGRAALAVILPLLVCCLCFIVAAVLFGAAIMAAFQGMKP